MDKLLTSFACIFLGLAVGYAARVLVEKGKIRAPMELGRLRKLLQRIGLLGFMYIAFIGAIWAIRFDDPRIAAMPFIGAFALLLGGSAALLAARPLGLTSRQKGSFYACGSFTNIGSIGSLVCFVFLGENGFAFVPVYKLFEEIIYFGIGFPITKYFSGQTATGETAGARLKGILTDVFVMGAMICLITGVTLNLSGIQRPAFMSSVISVFVPAGTICLLVSIGLAMRFSSILHYMREIATVAAVKFLLIPLSATAIAWAVGLGEIERGLPLKVVLICSSMPVAFIALIPPSIYDLDIDLSNACWLATTLALVIVLPAQLFLLDLF